MNELDKRNLIAVQIAEVAQTDITTVQTWTTRGLTEQYGLAGRLKRGRGHARMYSLRDALKFSLMVRLHQNYRMPLPQGINICRAVFGDTFKPANAKYMVVSATPTTAHAKWYPDEGSVARDLSTSSVATVINAGLMLRAVSYSVNKLLSNEGFENPNT